LGVSFQDRQQGVTENMSPSSREKRRISSNKLDASDWRSIAVLGMTAHQNWHCYLSSVRIKPSHVKKRTYMNSKVIGSILLIVAMSIGGGLLSLPVVTAAGGFFNSTLLLIFTWLVITIGSLFILEICLRSPKGSNLISMSRDTLGLPGQIITGLFYLLMLYCIMCVYVSGGTDLIHSIFQSLNIKINTGFSTILFVFILGCFVWHGIKLVDHTNRALMTGKMAVYFLLILILAPSVHLNNLPSGSFYALSGAVMPAIFSFGYSIIIPSLCTYLDGNVKQLRAAVLIGSFIPLICFIIWNYTVQGTLTQEHLMSINQSGKVISQLNAGLSSIGNPWVTTIIHLFTSICLLTAFLAVSLSLSDVIANGIHKPKQGKNKWLIYALTFLPPVVIIIFRPFIFITAIQYAGILVVGLLILLPTLMVWRSRQVHKLAKNEPYRVPGGIFIVFGMLMASGFLLFFAATHL
jgi:tyrosine-specific transport protein